MATISNPRIAIERHPYGDGEQYPEYMFEVRIEPFEDVALSFYLTTDVLDARDYASELQDIYNLPVADRSEV